MENLNHTDIEAIINNLTTKVQNKNIGLILGLVV